MPLTAGQLAPDFTLYTDARQPWTLSEHRGHPVLLLFLPGAFTSVCTTELDSDNSDLDRYAQVDARVVGISTDSPFALAEYRKAQQLEFSLLSDHEGVVSAAYGTNMTRTLPR